MKLMQRKRWIILVALILISAYFISATVSEFGFLPSSVKELTTELATAEDSGKDEDWTAVDTDVVLENGNFLFSFDYETTRFTITDRTSGKSYSSFPENVENILENPGLSSNLTFSYYDAMHTEKKLGSNDSVAQKNYTVKRQDQTLRIYYSFGFDMSALLLPQAIKKETFENIILPNLKSNSSRRRLGIYYTLHNKDTDKAMTERYPYLNQAELYILSDELSDVAMKEISGYLTDTPYTEELYQTELNEIGISGSEQDIPSGFVVPLELTLCEDGLVSTVLVDKIKSNIATDLIQRINLLEYFGACDKDAKGYFLVPDGSGALINLNRPEQGTYYQRLYGEDVANLSASQQSLSRNATLPIFGVSAGDAGFLAVVEKGTAIASLNARVQGSLTPLNHIYTTFAIRDIKIIDETNSQNAPTLNLYAKHNTYENPSVRYFFLKPGQTDYSGMAVTYRNYLEKNQVLTAPKKETTLPFYIDFYCVLKNTKNFLGVSYDETVLLSDLASIEQVVSELSSYGVKNIVVRFKGAGKDGLYNSFNQSFGLNAKFADKAELAAFKTKLDQYGARLVFDADFMFVYKNRPFDALKESLHFAKQMDKVLTKMGGYDRVTLNPNNTDAASIISPAFYGEQVSGFMQQIKEQGLERIIEPSWGTAGQYLYSDFDSSLDYDRNMSRSAIERSLEQIRKQYSTLVTDYGNSYVLKYATDIVNAPISSSNFDVEDESVPFYQMIVHSYINYSSPALNLRNVREDDIMGTLAAPYVVWMTGQDSLLHNTALSKNTYSLHWRNSVDRAVDAYQQIAAFYPEIATAKMIKHSFVATRVELIEFANGKKVICNNTEKDFVYNGVTVSGGGYLLLE